MDAKVSLTPAFRRNLLDFAAVCRIVNGMKRFTIGCIGARNRMWLQMKADILGVPVTSLATADTGTTGSAMLAGIASGVFRDLPHAAGVMVKEKETFYPRAEMQAAYEPHYQRYKKMYAAVRPLMEV